jgi:hypothetical protein
LPGAFPSHAIRSHVLQPPTTPHTSRTRPPHCPPLSKTLIPHLRRQR